MCITYQILEMYGYLLNNGIIKMFFWLNFLGVTINNVQIITVCDLYIIILFFFFIFSLVFRLKERGKWYLNSYKWGWSILYVGNFWIHPFHKAIVLKYRIVPLKCSYRNKQTYYYYYYLLMDKKAMISSRQNQSYYL